MNRQHPGTFCLIVILEIRKEYLYLAFYSDSYTNYVVITYVTDSVTELRRWVLIVIYSFISG